jgi:hypothetical protein
VQAQWWLAQKRNNEVVNSIQSQKSNVSNMGRIPPVEIGAS